MRVRATVEFEFRFDDGVYSLEELVSYHKSARLVSSPSPTNVIGYEIKQLLETEFGGLAEYDTAEVVEVAILND